MTTRRITLGLAVAGILALAACNPNTTTGASPTGDPTSAAGAPAANTTAKKAVPNLIGKGLQTAQDTAQAAGFYNLTSHDSLGRGRMQLLDRDWQVCFQNPAAGTPVDTTTKLDFGAVKLDETCPTTDEKPPAKAGATMPNYVGKGLGAAHASLPSSASVTSNDLVAGRAVIIESNWKVCSQAPKAGTPYSGQPVVFNVVKTDETCP